MDKEARRLPISLKGVSKGAISKMLKSLKKVKSKHYDAPFKRLGDDVVKGYTNQARKSGTDSLVMSVPGWLLPGKLGEKYKDALVKNVSIPVTKMDTALGNAAGKLPGMKNVFKIKEKVPVAPSFAGRQMKKVMKKPSANLRPRKETSQMYKEVNRPSLAAPVTKTMNVAVPFAGAYTIDKQLGKLMDKNKESQQKTASANIRVSLEKTAAVKLAKEIIRLQGETSKLAQANANYEKRAKAQELIFKQASMGLIAAPRSYQELQEKVASLENQDLAVLEKALELQIGDVSMGKIASDGSSTVPTTPESQFAADLMEEDDSLF